MDTIVLEFVTKSYKSGLDPQKTILDNISICVKEGRVFGLLGPNGAGKSTTIKILLNFITPDSGRVFLDGEPPGRYDIRKRIGYMSEKPCLYRNMTVKELLSFKASVIGINRRKAKASINELLQKLGLFGYRDHPLRQFSKGMLQRSSLALALIHDPQILILDEPLSGLDPLIRYEVIELLKVLKEKGKTIFFSSHILNDIEKVCDEIAILNNGQLKYTGKINKVSVSEGLENFFVKVLKQDE